MQVEEIFLRGKKQRKTLRISLLDDYYYYTPSSEANQNAGFALVHYLDDTNKYYSPSRSRPLVTHKITLWSANYSACVVYTKTLSVGER